jgi:uncharacterized membrane protein YdjX (TVP38/TMEM64 family)
VTEGQKPEARSAAADWLRPALAFLLLCVVVLAPFLLWEAPMTALARDGLAAGRPVAVVASVIVLLLAADMILPVPSSLVATAAGALLGPVLGAATAALGLTLGGAGVFLAIRRWGVGRWALGRRRGQLEDLAVRHGAVLIAVLRPVPVLAEASVIAAAVARTPVLPALAALTLSNLGMAAAYAALGAAVESRLSFLMVFAAACLLPGLAWGVWRITWGRPR